MLIKDELINENEVFIFGMLLIHTESEAKVPVFINRDWNKYSLSDYNLYIHKSERLQRLSFYDTQVYILGDIYSTNEYGSVESIIESFLKTKNWELLEDLSGRFNIIIDSLEPVVLHDSMGTKTLYYSTLDGNSIVTNHATLIGLIKKQKISPEIKLYKQSDAYNIRGTRFLPGDITMFEDVYGMVPNNYFDIKKSKTYRYYYYDDIRSTTLNEFKHYVYLYYQRQSEYFKQQQYLPVLSLTGGFDSRLAIAAFKHFNVNFELMTWSRGVSVDESAVIEHLAKYLKKNHTLIDTKAEVQDNSIKNLATFSNYNTSFSRGSSRLTALLKEALPNENYVFIRGLGGEILRGMFNKSNSRLKSSENMSDIEYVTQVYNTNLIKKVEVSDKYLELTDKYQKGFFERANIDEKIKGDIGDLAYWEQRMGRWAAELHNEGDAAMKNFTSLNSKKIYKLAYGLSDSERFSGNLMIELISLFDKDLSEMPYV